MGHEHEHLTQEGSWDDAYGPAKGEETIEGSNEPGEDWYAQWDPLDNGKAGPIRMKIFWLCAFPGLLQFLCGSLFLPALPDINEQYQPSAFLSTLTISIYSLFSGIVPILWGPICDKYSRKWVLVANLFFYALLNYVNAWNNTMWGIIVLRSLIAIPLASFFVCVTGILSDIFREKERAFWLGVRNLPGFLSVLLAPPIGGVLVYLFGWRSTAVVQAFLGIVAMIVIMFFLPETLNKEQANKAKLNPFGPILIMLKPRIIPNALVQGIGFSAMYLTVAAIPLTFPTYYEGVTDIVIGLSLVPFAVGSAFGAVCGGLSTNILKKKLGVSATLVSSLFWNLLCLPAFIGWGYTLAYNIWLPIFFTAAIGFLRNATTPPMLMFCMEEVPGKSSAVNAGLLAIQFVFGAVVLSLFPPLAEKGISWGILMVGLSIAEFLCFIPIAYMTYTTFKNSSSGPKLEEDEYDPLVPPNTFSTNSMSGLSGSQREFRDSSIGYISDSSEFLR